LERGPHEAEIAAHYGHERVHEWHLGYATRPPALNPTDPRQPRHDARYRELPN